MAPYITNKGYYTITSTSTCSGYYPVYVDYEKFTKISEIKEMKAGWGKPSNHFRPVKLNSNVNYNLPRSRLREKKQTFLLKAA